MNRHDRRAAAAIERAQQRQPRYDETTGSDRTLAPILWARFLLAFCLVALAVLPSFAHHWYDPECCSTNDCAPVPAEAVTAEADGWHVRLSPGDHAMVNRGVVVQGFVPYADTLPSQDGGFHACVRDQSSPSAIMTDPIICLYVPEGQFGT